MSVMGNQIDTGLIGHITRFKCSFTGHFLDDSLNDDSLADGLL